MTGLTEFLPDSYYFLFQRNIFTAETIPASQLSEKDLDPGTQTQPPAIASSSHTDPHASQQIPPAIELGSDEDADEPASEHDVAIMEEASPPSKLVCRRSCQIPLIYFPLQNLNRSRPGPKPAEEPDLRWSFLELQGPSRGMRPRP